MTIQELIKNTKNWLDEYEDFDDRHWEIGERREFRYRVEEQKLILELAEKAEKYRWHDLRENPDDLPTIYGHMVRVCLEGVGLYNKKHLYYCDAFMWNIDLEWHTSDHDRMRVEKGIYDNRIDKCYKVIAWREIESFGGVENEN